MQKGPQNVIRVEYMFVENISKPQALRADPLSIPDKSDDINGVRGKPLGKPRIKPWVDIAKSHGPGGMGHHGPTARAGGDGVHGLMLRQSLPNGKCV